MAGISNYENEILSSLGFNTNGVRGSIIPAPDSFSYPDVESSFPDNSIPLSKLQFLIYDAVIDQQGNGTHLTIRDALNSGKKRIFVRAGVYVLTADINLSSDVTIVGESKDTTIINCGSHTINIKDTSGSYSTGIVQLTNGDATVVGSGTSWSGNISAGDYLYIAGYGVYKIASVTDDTHLELEYTYYGGNISSGYIIKSFIKNVNISNLYLKGSGSVFDFQDCINSSLNSLIIEGANASTAYGITSTTRLLKSTINDIKIFNVKRGLNLAVIQNSYINNIEIYGASENGVYCNSGCYDNNLSNILTYNCEIGATFLSNFRSNFINIISKYNNTRGLYLLNLQNCNLNKMQISLNGSNGIELYQCRSNNISGNQIYNNSNSSAGTYSNIIFSSSGSGSTYNNLVGNNIYSTTGNEKYGIREDNSSDDYNIIDDNVLYGMTTDKISIQGANTQIGINT